MADPSLVASPELHRSLYSNVQTTNRHASSLDVLQQMGFPRHRAEKAIVATGDNGTQLAADWLLSHVHDPSLDKPRPREFVIYLCPVGQMATELTTYWQRSLDQCGWNGAHKYIPHITLCPFFKVEDSKVQHLLQAMDSLDLKTAPSDVQLHYFTAPNFIGLFVEEECAAILRVMIAELASAVKQNGISLEPHQKQLHVTLAYQYPSEQHSTLERLSKDIQLDTPVQWDLRLYSREPRANSAQVRKVLYSHSAQNSDELDLIVGDFIYMKEDEQMDTVEQMETGDKWRYGTSWLTGCGGRFPLKHTEQCPESKTWTLHKSITIANGTGKRSSVQRDTLGYAKPEPKNRQLYVIRHGERVDQIFGRDWYYKMFDIDSGTYHRRDLNMPLSLPVRKDGPLEWLKDSPLTMQGHYQAKITGEALRDKGVQLSHVYSSPSFRCVETLTGILKGMGLNIPIRIEPGLFEWLGWYKAGLPVWFSPAQYVQHGFNIDQTYSPVVPKSEYNMGESIQQYYERAHKATSGILKSLEGKGGNVLLLAHAASLDVQTRQLTGGAPRNNGSFHNIVRSVPYCGVCLCEEDRANKKWHLDAPPILTLTHGYNNDFSWTLLVD